MAQGMEMVVFRPVMIFEEDELRGLKGILAKEPHYILIECGCSLPKYGDTVGHLKIFDKRKLEIKCHCSRKCAQRVLSPAEFAKHGGQLSSVTNWPKQIWVVQNDEKMKLLQTSLLKYHQQPFIRSLRGPTVHHDEFLKCTSCGKSSRFSVRTREEYRAYHDALLNQAWTCFDMEKPCDNEEERASRRSMRRCPRPTKCEGCLKCVCFGCSMCRFDDCSCRTCVDYCQNSSS